MFQIYIPMYMYGGIVRNKQGVEYINPAFAGSDAPSHICRATQQIATALKIKCLRKACIMALRDKGCCLIQSP
ncbi:hypothetical protein [Dyadobacter tibetensis]|uniref:hypothetical protein n=1 Tax=Dyadobacter tibetensis TaxID=1211851 RepID=UPI0004BCEB1E|nr:hypothetical protein [Dyadobacter tibetensis]